MVDTPLRLSEVPVSTLGAFMEAAAAHPTSDLTQLAGFAGFSPSTARKAVPTLETLGIMKRNDTGPYIVTVDGVARGISDETKEQILRRALLAHRAFGLLIEGIALGETKRDSIRKTLLIRTFRRRTPRRWSCCSDGRATSTSSSSRTASLDSWPS